MVAISTRGILDTVALSLRVARDGMKGNIESDRPFFSLVSCPPPFFFQPVSHTAIDMDSKAEGQRQTMLEKARRKIYEESERERQKIAKVTHS